MARVVVTGYMVRHPLAGNVLAYVQYVIGLHRLGHQVVYLEESGWDDSCYDPDVEDYGADPSTGLRVVRSMVDRHSPGVPVVWVDRVTRRTNGCTWSELRQLLAGADLLLNLGGVCWLPEFSTCRRQALVDMDPLFTQVGMFGAEALEETQVFFTYGGRVGRADCDVPTMGLRWHPLPPPVLPDLWTLGPPPDDAPFTTVANWSGYGGVKFNGRYYGQKDEEFLHLLALPSMTSQRLELAVSGAEGNEAALEAAGWSVRNAGAVSADIDSYRAYVGSSRGELSAAKHGYVESRSGWFSDRSVCYLAAGRPVILQDTGFSEWLPSDGGLLAFSSLEEAAQCLERVNLDYERQSGAARRLAHDTFGFDVVLPHLLDQAL